jgi:short-subunit dehydrogenase
VLTYPADVRDRERMAEVGRAFIADAGGITLAIANAGVSHGDRLRDGDAGLPAETIGVNVMGVMHTLQPLIPTMIEQGHGHLVAMGSMAGFRGMPGKGAYCASKAAVKTLMDAWRVNLRKHGVRVTTLCPGWVVSELTANNPYRMPFMLDTDTAARKMMRGIERGAATFVMPWQMRMVLPLIKMWPERLLPRYGTRA